MNLYKTSFYTGVSLAVTYVSGFVLTKIVALKIGPAGVGLVGQFQNSMMIFGMFGVAAIQNGVIKYLAEYKNDPYAQKKIVQQGISIVIVCSIITATIVVIFAGELTNNVFHSGNFKIVYILYGLFIPLACLNILFTSAFNGIQNIRMLTISNISQAIFGTVATICLSIYFGVKGVLIATNISTALVFAINFGMMRRTGLLPRWTSVLLYDRTTILKLLSFTLMNMLSGFLVPLSQMIVRNRIMSISKDSAGYWQGVTKISDYYLGFISSVLTVYYFPKLSELKDPELLKREIFRGYKVVLPCVVILAFTIWAFRGVIVNILYAPSFYPMKELFFFQLIGDVFKIASFLLSTLMLAKAMVKVFIITELFFNTFFVSSSFFFIKYYGVVGATHAFCATSILYFFTMVFTMKYRKII